MAKRGREGVLKRQRERARQEKQAAKREKRHDRTEDNSTEPPVNEDRLMEEFARLSERFDNGQLTAEQYEEERHRIFVELGIETDE